MLLHPIAVLALPVVAILAVLFANTMWLALVCIAVGAMAAFARGPRFGLGVLGLALSVFVVVGFGFSLSLAAPEATAGGWMPVRAALRMTAVVILYVVTGAYVRGDVLGDTLITRFGIPYRVIDVLGLGARFAAMIRRDVLAVRSLARVRGRDRPLRTLRLAAGLTVPVLIAAFRHADDLSIAMEARGFGSLPERTVHHARPLRWRDAIVVVIVWSVTIVMAFMLA